MLSKNYLLTLSSIVTLLSLSHAAQDSWNCQELEASTDSYYRMFPAYLGSAIPNDASTHKIAHITGHCFSDITVYASFKYLDAEKEHIQARLTFDLEGQIGMCIEHLQISTAFRDTYEYFIKKS